MSDTTNCTLKNGQDGEFYVMCFCHNAKSNNLGLMILEKQIIQA